MSVMRAAAPPLLCLALVFGPAATAFATPVDDYKHCKSSRGKGTGYECCLNVGGEPLISGGQYVACTFKGTKMAPQ